MLWLLPWLRYVVYPGLVGLEGWWCWLVGGINKSSGLAWCGQKLLLGVPQEPLGTGAPVSLFWPAFVLGSQMPSCLCWVKLRSEIRLISFLPALDFWISDQHWYLLWIRSTVTLSFVYLESPSMDRISLLLPLIFCGTTIKAKTLNLDGWIKLSLLWRPLGEGFFWGWGLWWGQLPEWGTMFFTTLC